MLQPAVQIQYSKLSAVIVFQSPTCPTVSIKVRTNSSTEFGSNPILIDRIRIESAAGSNPIRRALDRTVDFNERVTVFTTGRACAPISDIKGGNADIQLRCGPAHN